MDEHKELDYLRVDSFLKTFVEARALHTAFELRLIDHLMEKGPCEFHSLARGFAMDGKGLALLLGLLRVNHVVEERSGRFALSGEFREALHYRDLMETGPRICENRSTGFCGGFYRSDREPGPVSFPLPGF